MSLRSFYILGCQRSGTTLLRLILDSHSKIYVYDERLGYRTIASPPNVMPDGIEWLGFKIPRWTEQLLQTTVGDFGEDVCIPQFYQHDPLIFMVRNPQDTLCSMVSMPIEQGTWLSQHGIPSLFTKLEDSAFRGRYAKEIEICENTPFLELALGALYWKYKNEAFLDYHRAGLPQIGILYENLVREPEPDLRKITTFLDLPWEPIMLEHHTRPHDQLEVNGMAVGNTDPTRAIDQSSVGRYQGVFSAEQLDVIQHIVGTLYEEIQETILVAG